MDSKNGKFAALFQKIAGVLAGSLPVRVAVISIATLSVAGGATLGYVKYQEHKKANQPAQDIVLSMDGNAEGEKANTDVPQEEQKPTLKENNHSAGTGASSEKDENQQGNGSENGLKKTQTTPKKTTPAITPALLLTPTITPTVIPVAAPAASNSSSSSEPQVESRSEEKAPQGYTFPVFEKITPLDFNQFKCEGVEKQEQRKDTVLIYLCGTDLETDSSNASTDIMKMLRSEFDTSKTNVLVLAGGTTKWASTYMGTTCDGNGGNCVLYELHSKSIQEADKTKYDENITADTLRKIAVCGKQNMGDPKLLAGVMDFAYSYYPSERHSVVLWNHGGGINGGVCSDQTQNGDNLTIAELGSAFRSCMLNTNGKQWDMIGMDACMMAGFEVSTVLAAYGQYMIASEEIENGGWEYQFLAAMKNCTMEQIGRKIVADYVQKHVSDKQGIVQTLALIDLKQMQLLCDAFEVVAKELVAYQAANPLECYQKVDKARQKVEEFAYSEKSEDNAALVDLYDFIVQLKNQGIPMAHADSLLQRLNATVLAAGNTKAGVREVQGLTIYFSYDDISTNLQTYQKLAIFPNYIKFLQSFATARTLYTTDLSTMIEGVSYNQANYELQVKVRPDAADDYFKNLYSTELIEIGYAPDENNQDMKQICNTHSFDFPNVEKKSGTYYYDMSEAMFQAEYLLNGYVVETKKDGEFISVEAWGQKFGETDSVKMNFLFVKDLTEDDLFNLKQIKEFSDSNGDAFVLHCDTDTDWKEYIHKIRSFCLWLSHTAEGNKTDGRYSPYIYMQDNLQLGKWSLYSLQNIRKLYLKLSDKTVKTENNSTEHNSYYYEIADSVFPSGADYSSDSTKETFSGCHYQDEESIDLSSLVHDYTFDTDVKKVIFQFADTTATDNIKFRKFISQSQKADIELCRYGLALKDSNTVSANSISDNALPVNNIVGEPHSVAADQMVINWAECKAELTIPDTPFEETYVMIHGQSVKVTMAQDGDSYAFFARAFRIKDEETVRENIELTFKKEGENYICSTVYCPERTEGQQLIYKTDTPEWAEFWTGVGIAPGLTWTRYDETERKQKRESGDSIPFTFDQDAAWNPSLDTIETYPFTKSSCYITLYNQKSESSNWFVSVPEDRRDNYSSEHENMKDHMWPATTP